VHAVHFVLLLTNHLEGFLRDSHRGFICSRRNDAILLHNIAGYICGSALHKRNLLSTVTPLLTSGARHALYF